MNLFQNNETYHLGVLKGRPYHIGGFNLRLSKASAQPHHIGGTPVTSNPLPPPVSLPDIHQRNQADGDVVDPLGGPHASDGGGLRHQEDIDDVDDEDAELQGHGSRGVACARDSLEEGHGKSAQQSGGTDHIHRRDGRLRQSDIVRVNLKDEMRNYGNNDNQNQRA